LGQTGLTAADAIQRTAADRGVQPGDCEVDAPAIGLWSLGAGPLGTVLCYQDGVNGVIEWTLDEETLLLKVSVPYADEKGMLDLWIGYRDKVGSNVGSAPFPTTAEEALLRRLPTSLRADCQRGSYGLIANKLRVKPVASITCPLGPDSGAKRVDLLQISDFEDVTASEVVAAIGAEPGRCPRTGPADDRWSNGERDVGAVVCYADLLDQIVAWSYDDDRLVARASSRGGADLAPGAGAAFARLWDWWLASAKTISQ
jgi:hypothetical protein